MTIRAAPPDDIALIMNFIRALADYEKMSDKVAATEDRLRTALFGAKPAVECVLAFIAGRPVGFAVFFQNFSTFLAQPGLYLEDLFVKPEYRGRGVGKALLLHLARLANQRGCGRMEWTVLDWNQPAIDFYESLGARRLKEWNICRLAGSDLTRYV